MSMNAEPKTICENPKDPEVLSEIKDLSNYVSDVNDLAMRVKSAVASVLSPHPPYDSPKEGEAEPNTDMGASIRVIANQSLETIRILDSIIHNLEI